MVPTIPGPSAWARRPIPLGFGDAGVILFRPACAANRDPVRAGIREFEIGHGEGGGAGDPGTQLKTDCRTGPSDRTHGLEIGLRLRTRTRDTDLLNGHLIYEVN